MARQGPGDGGGAYCGAPLLPLELGPPAPSSRDAGPSRLKGPAGPAGEEAKLVHLAGTRCLLSIWILADHFIHGASVFGNRANIAVDCFIIMSGFVTHWAYGQRDLSSGGAVAQFYARRIGRVLPTTYVSMAAAAALMSVVEQPPGAGHMLRCALFLEPWLEPEDWCPNGQSWTVAALLPSWLLYPLSARLLAALGARRGGRGLAALGLALWLLSLGPSLLLFGLQGGWLTTRQHNFTYVWPPSQLADFGLGTVAAGLARRHETEGPGRQLRGSLADLALALTLLAALSLPSSGYHEGWEPLFNHGLAPLLAAFLYGSAAEGGAGAAARLLALPPLGRLGKYSFEIFLFQQPLFSFYQTLWIGGLNEVAPKWLIGVLFMATLFSLSALYAEWLEAPFVAWLKARTAGWA